MLQDRTPIVSVDDHIIEPRHVWTSRLPQRYREQGPRIVEIDGGIERWIFEGEIQATVDGATGLSAVAGTELSERMRDPGRYDNMRPGCYDPVARLADMDLDGVSAQVLFPNFSRFAGMRFTTAKDKDLGLLCVRAYNDFILDEWREASPDRYIPLIILPLWDVTLCVAELERCVAKGAKGLTFPDNPAMLGMPSFYTDYWNPLFAAIEAADLAICMHFGSAGVAPSLAADGPAAAAAAVMGSTLFHSMSDLVFSPVLHRFSKLKILYSEGGIGWFPFAAQRLDQVWEKYRFYQIVPTISADHRPSDLIRRNVFGCFIDDQLGIDLRHQIGVENITFETDYPHSDSIFPASRDALARMMADVPDDEVDKMVYGNACRLFNLDPATLVAPPTTVGGRA
ncbi:MAG TPA: amidohydrolase family protein [Ilumatobacteraceae bacterium]|nr:amidohydrolase family protein [Ilumatobacteraceae bacterium]